MLLIGIDIGTTNTKVGIFRLNGECAAVSARPTVSFKGQEGYSYYDPEQMWDSITSALQETVETLQRKEPDAAGQIRAIGITSMAESGLLVDRGSGAAKSIFMPYFDTVSTPQAGRIAADSDPLERFAKAGIHNSFKLGLPKLLWLQERDASAFANSIWLSASGYIAYRLSGVPAFDYTLAARTYAYDIGNKRWDTDWIRHFGLDTAIFPDAHPSGAKLGTLKAELAQQFGLANDVAVAIAGHDHIVASLSVGAITPDIVYDSMGTAETLVGTMQERPLGSKEFQSGLSYGCHVVKDRMFWMGGQPSSGGSVEWLRAIVGDPLLGYDSLLQLLSETKEEPTGILYFPYLSGSGAPKPDGTAKAAFVGLTKSHGRGDLIKAVLKGTAYQLQAIRQEAEHVAEQAIEQLVVIGGGTRNPYWLQIKSDVLGCALQLPEVDEASLLGAALCAGIGAGVFASAEEAVRSTASTRSRSIVPDQQRHQAYRSLYENGFVPLQVPLRSYYRTN